MTGLRLCELLALTREDIDFARQTLRVRKRRGRRRAGGSRLLPVGPRLLQVLAEHLARPRPSSSLVFPNPAGEKLNPQRLKKDVLYFVLSRLHLPRRTASFDSFRCSRKGLLDPVIGDPRLIAAVGEQRRSADMAKFPAAWAARRALALALEQAILGGPPAATPQTVAKPIPRIKLDIPSASHGESAGAAAATAQTGPQSDGEPATAAAVPAQPETDPGKPNLARMRLEAFLGGGPSHG